MNAEYLRSIVDYNPETGVMIWREKEIKHPSEKRWKKKYAGNPLKTIDGKGYFHFCHMRKFYRVHRMAWLYMTGELPNIIDHINGDRQDNRFSNLRNTTQQGNHLNQRVNSTNTSGVSGVYKNKSKGIWCAQIKFNGKTRHLGSSKSFFEAVCLRKSEERKLGFSLNHGVRK